MTTFTVFRLLPERPDLDQYRRQARELLRACHTGKPEAIERFDHWLFHGKPFEPEQVRLNDAQIVIAEEHGCRSWPKFVEMIQEKLQEGVDPPPFRQARDAIQNGDVAVLRKLLRQHPELPNARSIETDGGHQTLLHYIAGGGTVAMAEQLVAAGALLDALTLPFDMTPVACALYVGNTAVASYLADQDNRPLSFSMAGGLGRVDVMKELIGGRDPLPPYLEPGVFDPMRSLASAFRYACSNDQSEAVEYLLDLGLDVNVLLQDGATGLHLAAGSGHRGLVQLLLRRGADKTIRDRKFGGDPAGWAATFDHHDVANEIRTY